MHHLILSLLAESRLCHVGNRPKEVPNDKQHQLRNCPYFPLFLFQFLTPPTLQLTSFTSDFVTNIVHWELQACHSVFTTHKASHHTTHKMAIQYLLLLSRQGKVRLAKWFTTLGTREKAKIVKEVTALVLSRRTKMCNVIEHKGE